MKIGKWRVKFRVIKITSSGAPISLKVVLKDYFRRIRIKLKIN